MKKKLFLLTTLAALVFSAGGAVFAKNSNLHQMKTTIPTKPTAAEKKEAREKRAAAKKEAEKKRKEARLMAKNAKKTAKKKHKKFLGIF